MVCYLFSSVAQLCPTLCNPMDCSMPGLPVHPNSRSLLKLMSIELVILSNQLILYCPLLLLPSNLSQHQDLFQWPGSFPMSQLFTSGGQSIGTSTSVLPVDKKGWFPLLTNLVSFLSKGLSRVFCNTTVQRHQFFGAQPSLRSNSYNSILGLTCC